MVGGVGVFVCTWLVKNAKQIPWITSENVASVRACAAVLSAVAAVVAKLADGSLDTVSLQDLFQSIFAFAGTWALAHGIHAGTKAVAKEQPPI